jgi:pre-mRNA-processing factor 19
MADQEEEPAGLPKEYVSKVDETNAALSATRRKRKPAPEHATADQIKTYTSQHTIGSLHSPKTPGINALALSRTQPGLFVTGGNDKIVQLYEKNNDRVVATFKGHTKKIHAVALRELADGSAPRMVLSASADKTARVWGYDDASQEYAPRYTSKAHKGEVTGLFVHPTKTIFGLSSLDRTYSIHDLAAPSGPSLIFQSAAGEDAYTTTAIHPDGVLVGFGTHNSSIQIFDIRSGSLAATLTPDSSTPFTVNTLSFSENGYHLLAPDSTSSVAIWDLRKQTRATTIDLGEFKVNKVEYDSGAQYFAIAGSAGARIHAHKTWEELVRFEDAGEVSDVVFGELGQEVWTASGREVRVWKAPQ